jgi:hypothetical protein
LVRKRKRKRAMAGEARMGCIVYDGAGAMDLSEQVAKRVKLRGKGFKQKETKFLLNEEEAGGGFERKVAKDAKS